MSKFLKEPHGTLIWATGLRDNKLVHNLKAHCKPSSKNWLQMDVIVNYFR